MRGYQRVIMIPVLLLLVTSMILVGCTQKAPEPAPEQVVETVKVGVNVPLSGRVASMGNKGKAAFEVAAEKINEAGGIKSLGGAKLELVFVDNESKPEVTGLETERLITREKVSVIIGAYLSGLSLVGTEVAEKYQVPWVCWITMSPKVTERGFKYTFRPQENNALVAPLQVGFMKYWGEQVGKSKVTYFDVYVDDAMGQTAFPLRQKSAAELGPELVGSAPVPPDLTDFTSVMLKIKKANPDVLFVWQHEEEAIMITKAMAEHRIDVPCIYSYGTFLNAPVVEAVGPLKEGWFEHSVGNDYMLKDPWVAELASEFTAHCGDKLDSYSSQALQAMYIVADALERAASREPEAIRNALAGTNIKAGDKAFICGYPVAFSDDGQNRQTFSAINQTWGGKVHPIYPSGAAEMEPDYKPTWNPTWAWLK